MMTVLSTLVVEIVGDISQYSNSINQASGMTSGFAGSAVNGLSALGGTIVMGALAAGAAGVTALGFALNDAAGEAMAAEAIMAQTSAVIASTGGAAGMTADEVAGLAGALSEVTTFEDDTIQSAENMLLTFTSIGKDVFPTATETVLDMSQALGQDLKSSAIQLGKALQDPVAGVSALARVGVNFTDEQKLMIEQMVKGGDVMGAQKFILAELNREFGGSARAAADTAAGGWTVLMNKLGNIKEMIGGSVLPAFGNLTQTLSDLLEREDVKQFIQDVADGLGRLAQTAADNLPGLAQYIQDAFSWLMNNQGVIVAVFAVITVAIVTWAVTSAIAIAPLIWEMLPLILVITLIGVAVYLMYQAWTQNWGGIREKTMEVWAILKPVIDDIIQWFKTNIPYAWSLLKDYWNNTMVPMFQGVYDWFAKNIPIAIAMLQLKWGELQISMFMVKDWVDKHLMPMFNALGELMSIVLPPIINGLGILLEKFGAMGGGWVVDQFNNLLKVLVFVGELIGKWLTNQFIGITGIIDGVTWAVQGLVDALKTVVLPEWLGGDTAANLMAVNPAAGSVAPKPGNDPHLRVMPGITMNYYDNATIRSGETSEIIDKLGPALAQYLRQVGAMP